MLLSLLFIWHITELPLYVMMKNCICIVISTEQAKACVNRVFYTTKFSEIPQLVEISFHRPLK